MTKKRYRQYVLGIAQMKCNAPLNNMYFTVEGKVAPCWLQVGAIDNWSNNRSISEIWFGDKFGALRDAHKNDVYPNKCGKCKQQTDDGVWPLAKAYDKFSIKEYPTLIELELSNQCNLECIMCSGLLSSGIRKNRDNLPPLPQIYDQSFIEQLKEFIPHLEELRFNGGEPFAQKIVLDICDVVAEINPTLKINIATNGTVYNKRVRHIMDNCNLHINISIDSLDRQRYSDIRINGNLDVVLKNFTVFNKYCKENDRGLSVMVNPMNNNWREMHEFVDFCNTHDVNLWFNTIKYPEHLAIWNLGSSKLTHVYNTMKDHLSNISNTSRNYEVFEHLVDKQIGNWLLDSYVE